MVYSIFLQDLRIAVNKAVFLESEFTKIDLQAF